MPVDDFPIIGAPPIDGPIGAPIDAYVNRLANTMKKQIDNDILDHLFSVVNEKPQDKKKEEQDKFKIVKRVNPFPELTAFVKPIIDKLEDALKAYESKYPYMSEQIARVPVYVGGGAILATLLDYEVNDYDIFYKKPHVLSNALQFFAGHQPAKRGRNFTNFDIDGKKVQIIHMDKMEDLPIEEQLRKFDLAMCCVAYDGEYIYHHEKFDEYLMHRKMEFLDTDNKVKTIQRIIKYAARGFTIDPAELAKVMSKFGVTQKDAIESLTGEDYKEEDTNPVRSIRVPIMKARAPHILAKDIVSVQPMTGSFDQHIKYKINRLGKNENLYDDVTVKLSPTVDHIDLRMPFVKDDEKSIDTTDKT